MKKFAVWLEQRTLQDIFDYVKTFTPSVEKPFPSASSPDSKNDELVHIIGSLHPEILDIMAVLARRKPAVFFDEANFPEHLIKKIELYIKSMGMIFLRNVGLFKNQSLIGLPQNVFNINNAFNIMRGTVSPMKKKQLHKIVGQNLGYPPEAIESFLKKLD